MTLDEYYQLLTAGQNYVRDAQAADPAWQDWLTSQSNYNLDTAGSVASPTTDYWGQYMATLSPQQQAEFAQTMAQLKDDRWTTKVGSVMQYIPAAVATIGTLGATGALGGTALGELAGFPAVGNAFTGAASAGAAGAADAAASPLPFWDTGVGNVFGSEAAIGSALDAAGWFPGASLSAAEGFGAGGLMLADLLPSSFVSTLGQAGGASLLDQIINKAPDLLKAGGGLLGGGTAGGSAGGGSMSFNPSPTGPGRGYAPPATPARPTFKASTALTDLVRDFGTRQPKPLRPLGLLGDY